MKAMPKPRLSIITALEFLGLDDPAAPEGRTRRAIAILKSHLGHLGDAELAKQYESHLSLVGRRALYVVPIKRGGMLPFWSLLDVAQLQADLVPLGVLVRGAVTLGDAAAQGELVLGQGIAEAERLRDEVANVPRVIVHPSLLREVEINVDLRLPQHTAMHELGYIRELLRADADGLWFVDYLWAFQSEVDEAPLYLDFFKDHRKLVTQGLESSTIFDRSSHLWMWLWSYHNRILTKLKTETTFDDQALTDLRIPATSPLLYTFPPSAKAP